MLLPTELKVKELGDRKNQQIHVTRRLGSIYLNMFTRVEALNVKAVNGYIHPVDWVLLPPSDTLSIVFNLPFICSTFAAAVQHCGLDKDMLEGNTMSVFVPTDSAWKQLPFTDLVYLFSPLGQRDLKKILQYHVLFPLTCRSLQNSTMPRRLLIKRMSSMFQLCLKTKRSKSKLLKSVAPATISFAVIVVSPSLCLAITWSFWTKAKLESNMPTSLLETEMFTWSIPFLFPRVFAFLLDAGVAKGMSLILKWSFSG